MNGGGSVRLALVRALYDLQTELPEVNDNFYMTALQDIKDDGISSQVYFLLKQQGRFDNTPAFFQKELIENYHKGLVQNLFIKNQLVEILRCFDYQEIDVIPLKGVTFAEDVFGHVGSRATSDIDLLIRYQDLEKAIKTIKSLGYSVEEEHIPGHFHCSFSKALPKSEIPLVVEIHWSLLKANTSRFNIGEIWQESRPVGQSLHIKQLSPQHTLYMICLHGWRHNLESMKYFIDIIQVIHVYRNEIDYDQILKIASSHQTLKRMVRTLSIVYEQFPDLQKVKSFPYKRKRAREYRPVNWFQQYVDFAEYQFFSYDSIKHSMIEIYNWIWPSKFEVSSQIGYYSNGISTLKMYLSLYKKRVKSIIKAIIPH